MFDLFNKSLRMHPVIIDKDVASSLDSSLSVDGDEVHLSILTFANRRSWIANQLVTRGICLGN